MVLKKSFAGLESKHCARDQRIGNIIYTKTPNTYTHELIYRILTEYHWVYIYRNQTENQIRRRSQKANRQKLNIICYFFLVNKSCECYISVYWFIVVDSAYSKNAYTNTKNGREHRVYIFERQTLAQRTLNNKRYVIRQNKINSKNSL